MNGNRAAVPLLALLLAMAPAQAQTRPELVFVGSGRSNIEAFRLDPASGALTPLGRAAEIEHPSFLAIAPNHRFLYAVSEGTDAASSGVSAFAIDAAAGKLRAAQPPAVRRQRAVLRGGGRRRKQCAHRQLRQRQRGRLSAGWRRRVAARVGLYPGPRLERQSGPAGRAARPLPGGRAGGPVRLRLRPGVGQGDDIQV